MKIRDIVFDLTAFLDVILVLLFLVLTLNTGELIDYRAQLDESDRQRISIEAELAEAEASLADVEEQLDALSDWEDDRLGIIDEIGALHEWREIVENAVHFIFVYIQIYDDQRTIWVEANPDMLHEIEIIWADDAQNIITNEPYIIENLNQTFSEIIETKEHEHPVILMFNTTGIALQEYRLITRGIDDFVSYAGDDLNIYLSLHATE